MASPLLLLFVFMFFVVPALSLYAIWRSWSKHPAETAFVPHARPPRMNNAKIFLEK